MEKKAIVKSADMEESMQQDAIDCAAQVCCRGMSNWTDEGE
jgi:hypothetical protein